MIIRVTDDNKVLPIFDIGRNTEEEFIAKNSTIDYRSINSIQGSEFGCYKMLDNEVVVDTDAESIVIQNNTNSNNRAYLKDTDWYEIRAISGKPVPADILTKRQIAREAIV